VEVYGIDMNFLQRGTRGMGSTPEGKIHTSMQVVGNRAKRKGRPVDEWYCRGGGSRDG